MRTPSTTLRETFTSTGSKLFYHQEAVTSLAAGKGMPIVTHIMPTDVCNYKCAFCSVQYREGDALSMPQILGYLDQLTERGLKAVIISGGGNPILYKCPETKAKLPELIDEIHGRDLEIGLITNGIALKDYDGRMSYPTLPPEQLDKLTWLRISLAGWDHGEDCHTPDIDPRKTTLGGSYVLHDIYFDPADKKHGKVSTLEDLKTPLPQVDTWMADERLDVLTGQLARWNEEHNPAYVRLLPNCLEPDKIQERSDTLQEIANAINPEVFFVQNKPPRQPKCCLKGYNHPVLNCDGWVYPCDSVVLNKTAGHKFGSAWRICKWDEAGEWYDRPIEPNVPNDICPGCVFSDQVDEIARVAAGYNPGTPDGPVPEHVNFI